jgi:hypothetical protein
MPPPTEEEVNALIEELKSCISWNNTIAPRAMLMLTAQRAEIARLTKELKMQDEANDLLTAEIARLKAQGAPGWVALSERKPTKEDGDRVGHVLFAGGNWTVTAARFDGYGSVRTHWMRIPTPPPPSAEERQRQEDEEALSVEWSRHAVGGDSGRFANFCNGFRAALAHARKERAG